MCLKDEVLCMLNKNLYKWKVPTELIIKSKKRIVFLFIEFCLVKITAQMYACTYMYERVKFKESQ